MSKSTDQHRDQSANRRARCAVLTVSDTRTPDTDRGGPLIRRLLEEAGHTVSDHAIVRDEPQAIDQQLDAWLSGQSEIDLILTTGGTGIAPRDTTIEVIQRRLTQELPGFGELFRMLSYEEVGPAAMLSRAVAGLAGATLIFALPGSTNALELAMTKLILPELPHLVWETRRGPGRPD